MKLKPSKKSLVEGGETHSMTRGLRRGLFQIFESIRINLSDLDPKQVM
jgi:hypothetical protein